MIKNWIDSIITTFSNNIISLHFLLEPVQSLLAVLFEPGKSLRFDEAPVLFESGEFDSEDFEYQKRRHLVRFVPILDFTHELLEEIQHRTSSETAEVLARDNFVVGVGFVSRKCLGWRMSRCFGKCEHLRSLEGHVGWRLLRRLKRGLRFIITTLFIAIVVVTPDHSSHIDIFFLLVFLPLYRRIYFLHLPILFPNHFCALPFLVSLPFIFLHFPGAVLVFEEPLVHWLNKIALPFIWLLEQFLRADEAGLSVHDFVFERKR